MIIDAHAKINWSLDITGQRPDGYHLMDMLMQTVTLSDRITLTHAPEISLTTGGWPRLAPDERHLALRAARAIQAYTGYEGGAAIHVEKKIPVGAGMGGGSSDAAAVLKGLNYLWNTGLTQTQLEEIGLTLGADVPFCLRGGLTRTQGIGEIMQPLTYRKDWDLVVIQPCRGLSTGEVFTAYHEQDSIEHPDTDSAQKALAIGDAALLARSLGNVLQGVSEDKRPEIGGAIQALKDQGAFVSLMTGSGSAVFGVFEDSASANAARNVLYQRWKRTWRCRTCRESMVFLYDD